MILRSVVIPVLLLSFTFVNPCDAPKTTTGTPTEDDTIFDVSVLYPEFVQVPDTHDVEGVIDNSETHFVTANVTAMVEQILVREGDTVTVNDPVFTLSSTDLTEKIDIKRTKIKEYEARLREAQGKLVMSGNEDQPATLDDTVFLDEDYDSGNLPATYGDANNPKSIPKTQKELVEIIEAMIEGLTKEADALDRKLLNLTQITPAAGVVMKVHFSENNLVKEQDKIIEIAQTDPLSVSFFLPDDVASFIDKGSAVKVSPLAASELSGTGQVYFINPQLNSLKGGIEVRATFSNETGRIKAGQKAFVGITTRKLNNAILLPKRALFTEDRKTYVYVVLNDRAKLVAVKTGDETDDTIQVFGDLRVDDPIIIERPDALKHNSFVKIQNTK